MNMVFREWTGDLVKHRVVEMSDAMRKLPAARGPKAFGNNMPDVVRRYDEAYGFDTSRPTIRATAAEIARMEETYGWINTYLDEGERKDLYDYGFIKTRKGMYLERYLERNGIVRRTFERRINRCCQTIALALNRKHLVRLGNAVDSVSQNEVDIASTTVSSESRDHRATHWIAPDAKPQIDPALPDKRYIDHREIRARQSDKNRSLGAR